MMKHKLLLILFAALVFCQSNAQVKSSGSKTVFLETGLGGSNFLQIYPHLGIGIKIKKFDFYGGVFYNFFPLYDGGNPYALPNENKIGGYLSFSGPNVWTIKKFSLRPWIGLQLIGRDYWFYFSGEPIYAGIEFFFQSFAGWMVNYSISPKMELSLRQGIGIYRKWDWKASTTTNPYDYAGFCTGVNLNLKFYFARFKAEPQQH